MLRDLAAPPAGRPVCVLSCGRSGTSLATRVITLLGLHAGPHERMLVPNTMNERGYWEQRPLMDLNDEILARLGGDVWHPPAPPAGWEHDPGLADVRARATSLIAELFPSDARWVFKDPRVAVTLPFWRAVVGPTDNVVCIRRGAEVVDSALRANPGATRAEMTQWWLDQNAHVLANSVATRCVVVDYDEWFCDPLGATVRIGRFLHGAAFIAGPQLRESVAGFFDRGLRHHRSRAAGPVEVRELDLLLADAARRPGDLATQRVRASRAAALSERYRARVARVQPS